MVSCPFGALSSGWTYFLSNVTHGIISNILDNREECLIISDAMMLPGSEGGGVFNRKGELIGVCSLPLRRTDTTVDLNLIVACKHLLPDLKAMSTRLGNVLLESQNKQLVDSLLKSGRAATVLVSFYPFWATGIVLDAQSGCIFLLMSLFF